MIDNLSINIYLFIKINTNTCKVSRELAILIGRVTEKYHLENTRENSICLSHGRSPKTPTYNNVVRAFQMTR